MKLFQTKLQYQNTQAEKQRTKKLELVLNIIARKDYDELQKNILNLNSQVNAIKFQNQNSLSYLQLMINTIGGVVTPSEKLISIFPKDVPLIVKVNVLNLDIGFIKNQNRYFLFSKIWIFQGENRNKNEQFHFYRFGP